MTRRTAGLAPLFALALLTTGLAGCIGDGATPLERNAASIDDPLDLAVPDVARGLADLLALNTDPLVHELDATINIVFVGIAEDLVDTARLDAALPPSLSPDIPFGRIRADDLRSGLNIDLTYAYHFAPGAFADGLVAAIEANARSDDIPGGSDGFLARYDSLYDLGRAGDGSMMFVDAVAVETWMHENRGAHGLAFDDPEYTIFFLDTWTEHRLFEDTYYWYEFRNDTRGGDQTRDMRAWGGTFDFMFMDYAAAPNDESNDNSGLTKADVCCGVSFPAPAPEGTAYNDPPAWHYGGTDTATIGHGAYQRTVELTDRILHATDIGVNIRLIGDFTNRPVYKEGYHINVHLWHDGHSIMPKDGLDDLLDPELLLPGLQAQIPWSEVTLSIDTYVAPEDDPGMYEALNLAKAQAAGTYIPIAPIYQYVDAHKEKYKQNDPDVYDVMALLFLVEGHYTFFLPLIVGGVAFGGPDGLGWGTITSRNDRAYVNSGMDMDDMAAGLISTNAHEIGHFFGLTHAHDGTRRTADGGYEDFLDHTWSSTNTVMSYRMRPESIGTFQLDLLARAHALENSELTLRNTASVYRALAASGIERTPDAIEDILETATTNLNAATSLLRTGQYVDAVYAAIDARRAADEAMALAGVVERDVVVAQWSGSGVNSAGVKYAALSLEPSVTPTGVLFDYTPIEITEDVERITVKASWSNGPSSWGDLFLGWSREEVPSVIDLGPFPVGSPANFGNGVHDYANEDATSGDVSYWFTLDLDVFPILRELGEIWAGAGARGAAVNAAYDVEIVLTYRDHGDGTVPEGAMPAEDEGAGHVDGIDVPDLPAVV